MQRLQLPFEFFDAVEGAKLPPGRVAELYDPQKNATVEIPDKGQKEGKRKVPVKVGLSNGSVTEILSGLKEGEQVILQQ